MIEHANTDSHSDCDADSGRYTHKRTLALTMDAWLPVKLIYKSTIANRKPSI